MFSWPALMFFSYGSCIAHCNVVLIKVYRLNLFRALIQSYIITGTFTRTPWLRCQVSSTSGQLCVCVDSSLPGGLCHWRRLECTTWDLFKYTDDALNQWQRKILMTVPFHLDIKRGTAGIMLLELDHSASSGRKDDENSDFRKRGEAVLKNLNSSGVRAT